MKKKKINKRGIGYLLIAIVFISLCILILNLNDKGNYEKIKTECKSYGTDVVEKYTKDGDKYYVCN